MYAFGKFLLTQLYTIGKWHRPNIAIMLYDVSPLPSLFSYHLSDYSVEEVKPVSPSRVQPPVESDPSSSSDSDFDVSFIVFISYYFSLISTKYWNFYYKTHFFFKLQRIKVHFISYDILH